MEFLFILLFINVVKSQCPVGCICDEHDKTAQCIIAEEDDKFRDVPNGFPWFVQE